MAKKRVSFNVLLMPTEHAELVKLAEQVHLSRSDVIRTSLRAHFSMALGDMPHCANGRPCMCPHLLPPKPEVRKGVSTPGQLLEML